MPLKARTPDGSVTPEIRPVAIATGSEIAAGVRDRGCRNEGGGQGECNRACGMRLTWPPTALARSARDELM